MYPGAFSGPVRHVYVHVPFCRSKCDYCDFASQAVGATPPEDVLDGYVDGVAAEWERERAAHGVRRLHTLYLGGGTPSLLGPHRLERLLTLFRPFLTPGAEVTVEANPEDVDTCFAAWAAAAGMASAGDRQRSLAGRRPGVESDSVRVSLGAQSFGEGLRARLGRRAAVDPAAAFARLRTAGVRNLSVDLMYGLPGQSLADLDDDIAALLELRPEHVSCYELNVAAGTPLARRLQGLEGRSFDIAPDLNAAMYRRVVQMLERAGYTWCEVSSFALPGWRGRHNAAFWRARPYLGLGPGAVSTVGPRRWANAADIAQWREALAAGVAPDREAEDLDDVTLAHERLMLAARCGAPVPLAALAGLLDQTAAASLAAAGFIALRGDTIRVTRKGRYVADEVCVRLFRD